MLKKKTQVVMLSTLKQNQINGIIVKDELTNKLSIVHNDHLHEDFIPKYLYFLSLDETPKIGDWSVKSYGMPSTEELVRYSSDLGNTAKKVIGTTDKSLKINNCIYPKCGGYQNTGNGKCGECDLKSLPHPSKSFINIFVEKWNNNIPIQYVNVDYIPNWLPEMFEPGDYPEVPLKYNLKVDKNNEITITPIKESYSKKELQKLFDSYGDNFAAKIIWQDILNL